MLVISWGNQGRSEQTKSPTSDKVKKLQEAPAIEEVLSSTAHPLIEESSRELAEPNVDDLLSEFPLIEESPRPLAKSNVDEDIGELPLIEESPREFAEPNVDEDLGKLDDEEQWAALLLDFVIKVQVPGSNDVAYVDVREGSDASVRALKIAIMLATGIPCSRQRLTFESRVLCDDQATLGSIGLEHGMSISLHEHDSSQLSEADLADLREAFCKRMDEKFREAMQMDEESAVSESFRVRLQNPLEPAMLGSVGLECGMSPLIHTQSSNQLSEGELADLGDAFSKRVDEQFREAMQTDSQATSPANWRIPLQKSSEGDLAYLREAFSRRMEGNSREVLQTDGDAGVPEHWKVTLPKPLEFESRTDMKFYLSATDEDVLS